MRGKPLKTLGDLFSNALARQIENVFEKSRYFASRRMRKAARDMCPKARELRMERADLRSIGERSGAPVAHKFYPAYSQSDSTFSFQYPASGARSTFCGL